MNKDGWNIKIFLYFSKNHYIYGIKFNILSHFSMKISKILLWMFLFASFIPVSLANLSISPLKHEFNINPWQSRSEIIKVTNNSESPITLYTSKEDFVAWDDSWTPTFVSSKNKTSDEFSLSNWINIENWTITLAKWETREVRFTVNVPKDWEPGWHYWAIFFSPWAPSWAQVAVVQRLWVLILINVSWDVKIDWSLKTFQSWQKKDSKFSEQSDFKDFPIVFETKFENNWNVHIKPSWKITLVDEDWKTLTSIWKEAIINPAWAYIWEKLVDYIPVNDSNGNVLPKSSRKFESIWEWFWFQELKEDGTKIVKFKSLTDYYADKSAEKKTYLKFYESINSRKVNKKITATLELNYEWKNKEKKDFKDSKTINVEFVEQYVWINYYMLWWVIVLILIVWYYVVVIKPKNKAKLREELLKELKNK